jgi:hypothetical protein
MFDLRERATRRLLRTSVEHALDSLEIQQRHQSLRYHGAADDWCVEMVRIAEFVSRVSLSLAYAMSPTRSEGKASYR